LFLGVAWSLVTPAWQAPDENSHFGYVQYLAETGSLPGRHPDAPVFSTEQRDAADASNADLAAAQPSIKMNWDARAFARWRELRIGEDPSKREDAGGPNPAANNPPLYYLAEVPAYLLAKHGDVFTRLEALRIASLIWLLVAVMATWLLAGELFGPQPPLQLLAAGVVGLAPMVLFIAASVSPDSMLYASWAVVFWLGVRMLRHPATPARVGVFALAVGAACVVKATSYALLPGAALAVLVTVRRSTPPVMSGHTARLLAAAGVGLAATLGVWLVVARVRGQAASPQVASVTGGGAIDPREFFSYLWQFYLPKTSLQTDFASIAPTLPAWDFLVKGTLASFGWTEVEFDAWVYWVCLLVGLAVTCGTAIGLWADRAKIDRSVAGFFSLVVISLLAGLHVSEYRQLNAGALNFFQGRYLLPLTPLAGLAVARAALLVPSSRRPSVIGVTLAGLFAFNLFSLALVMSRFYA
jgi:4-amino-4-deoxy-L-arabinose transferase-like glycosyltransferase